MSTNSVTLRSAVLPRSTVLTDTLLVSAGTALIAACAQVVVHTPITPVPFTLQTFAVLFTGAALGSLRGTMSMALYLLIGIAGAPVFESGRSGAIWSSPTGGYLVGMLLAAGLTGLLAERKWDRQVWSAVPAMLAGQVLIFTFGALWLAHTFDWGLGTAISKGVTPFLGVEALKMGAAALVLPGAWKLVGAMRRS